MNATRFLVRAAIWAATPLFAGWMRTLRYRYRPVGPNLEPCRRALPARYIYAMWHENLAFPLWRYAGPGVHVLVSRSRDGQWMADLCRRLRISVVRGSTSRGGLEAVRCLLRAGGETHLALTPDGPRGPRRRVKLGVTYLAARTGLPIVPVGIGFERLWRLRSWDCFALPKPRSRVRCVTGMPLAVPRDADRQTLEEYRSRLEMTLTAVSDAAESWAASGFD